MVDPPPAAPGQSVQERLLPGLTCFGCGPANPRGLHLRSYDQGGEVTARFRPWAEHDNGYGYLNGGIIATVLDCHSATVALLEAERAGWDGGDGASLPFVTAGLDVRYLRPTPLTEELALVARLERAAADEVLVISELHFDGKPRATALATWKRWRPRPPT